MKKRILGGVCAMLLAVTACLPVSAAPVQMADGTVFDAAYYAAAYPDVAAVYGTSAESLYQHYSQFGKNEGRSAVAPGTTAANVAVPVVATDGFDAAYYASRYPDVSKIWGTDPALLQQHYMMCGAAEGRFPNAQKEQEAKQSAQYAVWAGQQATKAVRQEYEVYEKRVAELVNVERRKVGLTELSWSKDLEDKAGIRVNEIAGVFSHTRPNGTEFYTVLSSYSYCGENIARGQDTPEEVMMDWMNSSGHKANILKSEFTQIGVGYDHTTNCWVQLFLRP